MYNFVLTQNTYVAKLNINLIEQENNSQMSDTVERVFFCMWLNGKDKKERRGRNIEGNIQTDCTLDD